mgnify:CR=1 FL=1
MGLKNSIEAAKLMNKSQALFKAIKQIHLTLNPLVLSTILRENKRTITDLPDKKRNKVSKEETKTRSPSKTWHIRSSTILPNRERKNQNKPTTNPDKSKEIIQTNQNKKTRR